MYEIQRLLYIFFSYDLERIVKLWHSKAIYWNMGIFAFSVTLHNSLGNHILHEIFVKKYKKNGVSDKIYKIWYFFLSHSFSFFLFFLSSFFHFFFFFSLLFLSPFPSLLLSLSLYPITHSHTHHMRQNNNNNNNNNKLKFD